MTQQELRDYILRKLGSPVIHVEIATEQLDDCIYEAVQKFVDEHYDGIDIDYFFLNVQKDVREYTLNQDVESIIEIYSPYSNYVGEPLLMRPFYFNDMNISLLDTYDIADVEAYRQRIKIVTDYYNNPVQFDFNTTTKKLTLGYTPSEDGTLAVKFYRNSTTGNVEDVYDNLWLKKYAVALAKEQWGMNIGKYNGVTLPGGATMNGDTIMQMGRDDKEKLEQELEEKYSEPPDPLIG